MLTGALSIMHAGLSATHKTAMEGQPGLQTNILYSSLKHFIYVLLCVIIDVVLSIFMSPVVEEFAC